MKSKFLFFLSAILLISNASAQSLNLFANQKEVGKPLTTEEAFPIDVEYKEGNVEVLFDIVHGHYLYKDKIEIKVNGKKVDATLPDGEVVNDDYFGETNVIKYGFLSDYKNVNNYDKNLNIEISYQGCAEATNLCYPLKKEKIMFANKEFVKEKIEETNLPEKNTEVNDSSIEEKPKLSVMELAQSNNIADITSFLNEKPFYISALVFLLIGIVVAFTPCVYPMMPIIVASTNNSKTPKIAAGSYILGTILAYASIGLIVGLLNVNVQFIIQNKWFTYGVATILVFASLYLLGVFNLVFSNNINTIINEKIMKINPDKNRNQVIIGFLSSLLLSPCSIAPLLGVLVFINQMDAPLYGSFLLAMLASGIGIPLFLLTTSFNRFMPKSGVWMVEVKNIMAIIIYIIAVYIGARNFDSIIYAGLIALPLFIYGLYLTGLSKKQIVGTLIALSAILFFIQEGKIIEKNSKITNNNSVNIPSLNLIKISSKEELSNAINSTNKPVFVDFYADWCITCVRLENTVLKDKNIIDLLNKEFLVVKIDLTEISKEEQHLMDEREILGVPYYLFVDSSKKEHVYTGELDSVLFEKVLRKTMRQSNDR